MPVPPSNGLRPENARTDAAPSEPGGLAEVIVETEALCGLFQDAATRTGRLLAALKHQRRNSRAVQQALRSLRQLQLDH